MTIPVEKFKVKIKENRKYKGFSNSANYPVLAVASDEYEFLLLGDETSGRLEWFPLDSLIFVKTY